MTMIQSMRYMAIALVFVGWWGAQCTKGSGAPDVTENPDEVTSPGTKSVYVMLKNGTSGDVYAFNMPTPEGPSTGKSVGIEKTTSLLAASPMGRVRLDQEVTRFDISRYREILADRADGISFVDPKTDADGKNAQVVKNKITNTCKEDAAILAAEYDRDRDDVVYIEKDNDGTGHLRSRSMGGKITDLYTAPGLTNTGRVANRDGIITLLTIDGLGTFDRRTNAAKPLVKDANLFISLTNNYVIVGKKDGSRIVATSDLGRSFVTTDSGSSVRHIFTTPDELVQYVFAKDGNSLSVQNLSDGTVKVIPLGDVIVTNILRRAISSTPGAASSYAVLNDKGQVVEVSADKVTVLADVAKSSSTKSLPGKGIPESVAISVVDVNAGTGQSLLKSGNDLILISTTDGKELDRLSDATINDVDQGSVSGSLDYYLVSTSQGSTTTVGLVGGDTAVGLSGGKIAPVALGSISSPGAVASAIMGDSVSATPRADKDKVVADSSGGATMINMSASGCEGIKAMCIAGLKATPDIKTQDGLYAFKFDARFVGGYYKHMPAGSLLAKVSCSSPFKVMQNYGSEGIDIKAPTPDAISYFWANEAAAQLNPASTTAILGIDFGSYEGPDYNAPVFVIVQGKGQDVACTLNAGYNVAEGVCPSTNVALHDTKTITFKTDPIPQLPPPKFSIGSGLNLIAPFGGTMPHSVTVTGSNLKSLTVDCPVSPTIIKTPYEMKPNEKVSFVFAMGIKEVNFATSTCKMTAQDDLGQKTSVTFTVMKP